MDVVRREADEVRARVARFRGGRPPPDVRGRTVILVDDGIATGGTTRAAIKALRKRGVGWLALAVPVASPHVVLALWPLVDHVICRRLPRDLVAIGYWYEDFRQVADAEVSRLLDLAGRDGEIGRGAGTAPGGNLVQEASA